MIPELVKILVALARPRHFFHKALSYQFSVKETVAVILNPALDFFLNFRGSN